MSEWKYLPGWNMLNPHTRWPRCPVVNTKCPAGWMASWFQRPQTDAPELDVRFNFALNAIFPYNAKHSVVKRGWRKMSVMSEREKGKFNSNDNDWYCCCLFFFFFENLCFLCKALIKRQYGFLFHFLVLFDIYFKWKQCKRWSFQCCISSTSLIFAIWFILCQKHIQTSWDVGNKTLGKLWNV